MFATGALVAWGESCSRAPATSTARERCPAGEPCRPRSTEASAFICVGAGHSDCVQRWPRRPDLNEWDCAVSHGSTVCREHAKAAGLTPVASAAAHGYRCGPRNGHADERLCVDDDPDLPDGPGPWACRFDSAQHGARACQRVTSDDASGRTKTELAPNCWLDEDCETPASRQRCVAGRCTDGG